MTQGKIERWHQTLKNRILLENYFLPGDLEAQIAAFVADYNYCRYHESINNLTSYRRILVMVQGFRRRRFGIARTPGWRRLRSRQ